MAVDRDIAPAFVWHLGARADGTTVAVNDIIIRPGDVVAAAFDVASKVNRGLYEPGARIAELDSVLPASGDLVATALTKPIERSLAKIEVDGASAVDGTDYTVTADITMNSGDVIKASGVVQCRA